MTVKVTHGCVKPCAECPFARATAPGMTGGASPLVYIGQTSGPFLLSCHMDPGYEANRRSPALLQCAGAAIFRANIGVASKMPKALHALDADHKLVFSTPAELLAHHAKAPLEAAQDILNVLTPDLLLNRELADLGVETVTMPEPETK